MIILHNIFIIMKKICVFCGSSMGNDYCYQEAAAALGKVLADNGHILYYGGGDVGLMKIIADYMLKSNNTVIGVMPKLILNMEIGHSGITKMIKVNSMSERKNLLIEKSDAFIAMPGGFGTLDELFEVVVLNQLRIIDKPVALYNVNGYYNHLIEFIDHAIHEGFIRQEHKNNIIISDDPKTIVDSLNNFKPIEIGGWIKDIKEESK